MDEFSRMGMRVLVNERVTVTEGEHAFDIAGVPDHGAERFPEDGPGEDVEAAMAGQSIARRRALGPPTHRHSRSRAIGRRPAAFGAHPRRTNWPWGALVRLQQPFIRGHHRVGNCQLYVSCGTGFWGPPMRLGAPAEITEIILRSAQKQT